MAFVVPDNDNDYSREGSIEISTMTPPLLGGREDDNDHDNNEDNDNNNDNDNGTSPLSPPPSAPPPPPSPLSSSHQHSPRPQFQPTLTPRSLTRKSLRNDANLTDDEIELVLQNLAEETTSSIFGGLKGKITWSRYLVLNYFANWKWYNPNINNPDAPDLSKGWAYFEHFTLPRRFEKNGGGADIRAPPGTTKDTGLYGIFRTPQEALSDWGIGMSMYFSSLSAVIIIFLLAGGVNVANMVYYSSAEYDLRDGQNKFNLVDMLQFSAICMDREWVVCTEGCNEKENKWFWNNMFANEYYGTSLDENGNEIVLINKTTCEPAQLNQGMINYGTMMLLILLMSLLGWYLGKKEVRFDEDNSSPSDYTVVVHNPPPDAVDADEWRDFFNQFSDPGKGVTLCTVALNNEELLAKLVQRRRYLKRLKNKIPNGVPCDFEVDSSVEAAVKAAQQLREGEEELESRSFGKLCGCIFTPLLRRFGFALPEYEIWERIKATTEEIRELQQKEYNAAAVYVTFESEQGQRNALGALDASELDIMMNRSHKVDQSALFQGKVLRVVESGEPNAVRWADLSSTRLYNYLRLLVTLCITLGLIALSGFILQKSRLNVNTILFSVILTTFNSIIPIVVRMMVTYEKHYDEGSMQASLYLKITLFRWMNTAIITRLITPILVTLGEKPIDLINTVNSLMISEMILAPLLRYLDFPTILKRHYFAPRAKTEEELLSCFNGGWYNLAERFTDLTKVLLLCTFYSAFYPLIYFLGAAVLFGQYWMDKFLLLRSWQKAPNVGTETARFSRTYFNTAAVLLGAISSGYAYVRSPYTMLCSCTENNRECDLPDTQAISSVTLLNNTELVIEDGTVSNEGYYFCNQKYIDFPPIPSAQGDNKWMTESQEQLAKVYGWTCLVLLIVYCVFVLGERVIRYVTSLVKGVYEPCGNNQHKDFSSGVGLETFGYIPQLEVFGFHFPMLVCNIDDVDVKLMGWEDPNRDQEVDVDAHRSYDRHNLIFDVPHKTLHRSRNLSVEESNIKPRGENNKIRPIFSVVKHYPPEWFQKAEKKND